MEKQRSYRIIAWTGVLLASMIFFSRMGLAADSKYDFYSWPKENATNQWCFSILSASKDPVDPAVIKGSKDQICGRHDVKRLLGQVLPEGAKVYWKTNAAAGIVLPSREVVNDLMRFADTMDFKLNLPKDDPQAKRGDRWK